MRGTAGAYKIKLFPLTLALSLRERGLFRYFYEAFSFEKYRESLCS
jgi:hypothetical protein